MNDDVEVLLADAGAQWRTRQPAPPEPDWNRVTMPSRRPWWIASAAVVAAVAIAIAVAFWPSGNNVPPAHPTPSGPIVPAPTGASVPAPNVVEHSLPAYSYCPASALTGSLKFDSTIGQLRLALGRGIDRHCNLPGMLIGPDAVQLIDNAGQLRATGIDPRTQFPANPPYFGPLALGPGDVATMYVRSLGKAPCIPTGSNAVIRYNGSNIQVPITGLAKCPASIRPTKFWYGPFSTPGHPVALEPADWTNLSATLHFPATIPATGAVRFRVTLTNHSATQAAALSPCPHFGMVIGGDQTAVWPQGAMQCTGEPVVIRPGQSRQFTLVLQQKSRLPAGNYTVEWAIAGIKTAYANTRVS
jgi:hypothetical protein